MSANTRKLKTIENRDRLDNLRGDLGTILRRVQTCSRPYPFILMPFAIAMASLRFRAVVLWSHLVQLLGLPQSFAPRGEHGLERCSVTAYADDPFFGKVPFTWYLVVIDANKNIIWRNPALTDYEVRCLVVDSNRHFDTTPIYIKSQK